MFVEYSSDGQILAAYVEQQLPDQKWVPPSNEALQAFLGDVPRLGKDAKGRTCLLPAPLPPTPKPPTSKPCPSKAPEAQMKRASRVCGQSAMPKVDYSLAMRFACALYEDTLHEPLPWRWIGDTVKRAGMHDDQFKRALEVAQAAGLLNVHEGRSVALTIAGIRAVLRWRVGDEDAQSAVPALPAHPPAPEQHSRWDGNAVPAELPPVRGFAFGVAQDW
ncbi:hypothetical protein [Reyranella soli]|uniref:Uncharacterized protein n=1 Tax=Reyranella soli TaxID=1230389 RepID=A0A512NHB0_9HYPH|nr:hypothetical protein [Reyranella soli]GEP58305.1 hypothetical protein RSO01_54710 [Reyranella soli]